MARHVVTLVSPRAERVILGSPAERLKCEIVTGGFRDYYYSVTDSYIYRITPDLDLLQSQSSHHHLLFPFPPFLPRHISFSYPDDLALGRLLQTCCSSYFTRTSLNASAYFRKIVFL